MPSLLASIILSHLYLYPREFGRCRFLQHLSECVDATFHYHYYYAKYLSLIQTLKATCREVKFVNVSMSALGALDKSYDSLLAMLNDLNLPYNLRNRLISKVMNISIRCTYYIFCRRNKDWTDPALMDL